MASTSEPSEANMYRKRVINCLLREPKHVADNAIARDRHKLKSQVRSIENLSNHVKPTKLRQNYGCTLRAITNPQTAVAVRVCVKVSSSVRKPDRAPIWLWLHPSLNTTTAIDISNIEYKRQFMACVQQTSSCKAPAEPITKCMGADGDR